jgi:hypothetical protein
MREPGPQGMKEFLVKFPLVLLMVVGAFLLFSGIYGSNHPDPRISHPSLRLVLGLVLLFGPWAILRFVFGPSRARR